MNNMSSFVDNKASFFQNACEKNGIYMKYKLIDTNNQLSGIYIFYGLSKQAVDLCFNNDERDILETAAFQKSRIDSLYPVNILNITDMLENPDALKSKFLTSLRYLSFIKDCLIDSKYIKSLDDTNINTKKVLDSLFIRENEHGEKVLDPISKDIVQDMVAAYLRAVKIGDFWTPKERKDFISNVESLLEIIVSTKPYNKLLNFSKTSLFNSTITSLASGITYNQHGKCAMPLEKLVILPQNYETVLIREEFLSEFEEWASQKFKYMHDMPFNYYINPKPVVLDDFGEVSDSRAYSSENNNDPKIIHAVTFNKNFSHFVNAWNNMKELKRLCNGSRRNSTLKGNVTNKINMSGEYWDFKSHIKEIDANLDDYVGIEIPMCIAKNIIGMLEDTGSRYIYDLNALYTSPNFDTFGLVVSKEDYEKIEHTKICVFNYLITPYKDKNLETITFSNNKKDKLAAMAYIYRNSKDYSNSIVDFVKKQLEKEGYFTSLKPQSNDGYSR